ncbi:hypothetical protein [Cupriavidus metallidurans]|uniref:hypothetical protein n=1 Tax=Cupriavidus metallidurans TaxID=119219 RepID=UPI000492F2D0|nr:hypothetical protein [Cupriavidus metallidurans]
MLRSSPSIVFIIDKPAVVRRLAPHLSARWPGQRIFAITTLYAGLYEFRYPRGLSLRDFPYVSEPRWKPRPLEQNAVWVVEGTEVARVGLQPRAVLSEADLICFASDPDASGAVAFHVLLSETLGQAAALEERPVFQIPSLDASSIERALDTPGTTTDPVFVTWVNIGYARRFFDFNFNVNALALLGQVFHQVGQKRPALAVSKFGLQLLYGLQTQSPLGDGELLRFMEGWRGTSRHAPSPLGSPASRPAIVGQLLDAGLVTRDLQYRLSLSRCGTEFLALLHPDCEDADLPARLEAWGLAWPDSRPQMERYLRTFFGKQKRFAIAR